MDAVEDTLLAAIVAEVDADAPRLVYADWLLGRGDLFGEQIVLEHRLATAPATVTPELRERARELADVQRARLCFGHLQDEVIGPTHLGFVARLKLTRRAVSAIRARPAWLEQRELRVVRELDLAIIEPRAWQIVEAWRHRGHVRRCEHGSLDKALDPDNLGALVARFPALAAVKLRSPTHLPIERLAPLPLASFELELRDLEPRTLDALYAQPWALRTLQLRASNRPDLARLAPLLDGRAFPGVRDLELVGWSPEAVVEALVASGRIATIETLRMEFPANLARFARELAHVRFALPELPSVRPFVGLAVMLAQLGHYREAEALFARHGIPSGADLRWCAIAVREIGADRRALLARIRAWYREDTVYADLATASAELGDDPAIVLERARALIALGRGGEALATLADAPDEPSVHLVRALAHDLAGDRARRDAALARVEAVDPVYRALAAFLRDAPIEVGDPPDLDAATIEVIAAVCARDRARTRVALDRFRDAPGHRPQHPDLLVASYHRVRGLSREARWLATEVHTRLRTEGGARLDSVLHAARHADAI